MPAFCRNATNPMNSAVPGFFSMVALGVRRNDHKRLVVGLIADADRDLFNIEIHRFDLSEEIIRSVARGLIDFIYEHD